MLFALAACCLKSADIYGTIILNLTAYRRIFVHLYLWHALLCTAVQVCVDIFQERGHQADVKNQLSVEQLHGIVGNYDGMVIRSATKVWRIHPQQFHCYIVAALLRTWLQVARPCAMHGCFLLLARATTTGHDSAGKRGAGQRCELSAHGLRSFLNTAFDVSRCQFGHFVFL